MVVADARVGRDVEASRLWQKTQMQHYFLSRHAFVCAIDRDVIVLDLKHDKYLAFEREFWDPIARRIGGWPSSDTVDQAFSDEPDEAALQQLLDNGLLTADGGDGKDASPATIELPENSLMEDFRAQRPAIRASHVMVFLGAVVAALARLRFQPLERIVAATKRNRQREDRDADPATIRDLTEIYLTLRPLLFTSRNHCLFESLTLVHFLAHYRIHPTWVFGVQTAPFTAHCWLQNGAVAYNDTLDHIRGYTPIMLA